MMWGWNVSCCRWQVVVFWLLAITGCLVDLGSKEWVFAALPEEDFSSPEQYAGAHHSQYIGAHHTLWQASGDNPDNQLVPPGFHLHIAYRVDAEGHQVPHVNQGALFGLGGQAWGGVANGVFALVSLVVAVALGLYVTLKSLDLGWLLTLALGLIAGGAVGNLVDRVRFAGVRDFLHWNFLFDWPIFNLADVFLVIGAGLILLAGILAPPPTKKLLVPQATGTEA